MFTIKTLCSLLLGVTELNQHSAPCVIVSRLLMYIYIYIYIYFFFFLTQKLELWFVFDICYKKHSRKMKVKKYHA